MNKKLILAGAAAVVGFFSLTAFDGKTLEQQKAEIAQMVTSKLDAYRSELTAACDARVEAEAQTRYAAVVAAREAEAVAATGKPGTKKKTTTKGGGAKPLPPAKAPEKTNKDEKKDQMHQAPNTSEKKDQMQPVPAPNTNKKKQQMKEAQGGGN
jgi:hypothetical protein